MLKMKKKGYKLDVFKNRFVELSMNPQTGQYNEQSIFETIGSLELETDGMIKNFRLPDNPSVNLGFMAERVGLN